MLAEDPSIYVALGRRPRRDGSIHAHATGRVHPERVDPLIAWIAERRFDLVVLVVSLEDRSVDYLVDRLPLRSPRRDGASEAPIGSTGMVGRYLPLSARLHDALECCFRCRPTSLSDCSVSPLRRLLRGGRTWMDGRS